MSETTDKIVDKIVGDATSRLKVPIVSTYLFILIINNWDILFFIIFSKVDATNKILYIKNHYNLWDYFYRVGGSLLYAIAILVLFTFLDYYLVKYLKDISIKKKGIQQQIVDHSTLEDMKKIIESVRVKNNKLLKNIDDYKKSEVTFKEEFDELNSKYSNNYEHARLGHFIEDISKLPTNNINSIFYYLEKILIELKKYDPDEIINYESIFAVSGNYTIDKMPYNEIMVELQRKEYLTINERIQNNKILRSIVLNETEINFLFQYLNVN